jgi:hypothetical protein
VTPAAAIVLLSLADAAPARTEIAPLPAPAADVATATLPRSTDPNIVVPAVHGLALMTVMRITETVIWPDPFARPQYFAGHYEEAFTRPPKFDASQPFMRWDGDPLVVNVLGHALFGSELYLRARQCRFGLGGSLAFAAATSAVWEYAFEANGVRPSALDLVYTPVAGLVLGEARFLLHRAAKALRAPATRQVVRAVLDPFGELERAAGTDC